ncbi:MAG: twin-arginine translocase TatA/TatE family subunit [Candidatus Handelsmanbacteria bacterium]|nr:twin-arginine translocase TatA/TatE family subunit [Candidatus Handelsmanbacteria bacterium]
MLNSIGPMEILVIFLLILLLFGAKRIPEMAQGMGKGIKEFKKAMRDVQQEVDVSAPPTHSPNTIAPTPPANQVPHQAQVAPAPVSAEKKEQPGAPAT